MGAGPQPPRVLPARGALAPLWRASHPLTERGCGATCLFLPDRRLQEIHQGRGLRLPAATSLQRVVPHCAKRLGRLLLYANADQRGQEPVADRNPVGRAGALRSGPTPHDRRPHLRPRRQGGLPTALREGCPGGQVLPGLHRKQGPVPRWGLPRRPGRGGGVGHGHPAQTT